jgi:hypothetical protein
MTVNDMTHEVECFYGIAFSGFIDLTFAVEDMLTIISDLFSNRADGKALLSVYVKVFNSV